MSFITMRRMVTFMLAFVVLFGAAGAPASAQTETIHAGFLRCRLNVDSYSVQLQSGNFSAPASDFPASVTLVFADGSTAEATPTLGPNGGTLTYRLSDSGNVYRNTELVDAYTQFDTVKYPSYRFSVVAYPCDPTPTHTVTGMILQHGNGKPVAGAEVCIVEIGACTYTDANGAFAFYDVPDGVYTLTSTADVYKPLTTTFTATTEDVYLELIQYRGGGRG